MELRDLEILFESAYAWWKSKRPIEFTEKDHCKNPTVNMTTDTEKHLARTIVLFIQNQ